MTGSALPILIGVILLVFTFSPSASVFGQTPEDYDRSWCPIFEKGLRVENGFTIQAAINTSGFLGTYVPTVLCHWNDNDTTLWLTGLEYLPDAWYIWYAGPWIGAMVNNNGTTAPRVTTAFTAQRGIYEYGETFCDTSRGDGGWRTSIDRTGEPNRRFFDDDADGRIDEDELDGTDNDGDWLAVRDDLNHNGRPDHGEPNVDEDYGAVSESDFYFSFRDSFQSPTVPNHLPLGIRFFVKSFAWLDRVREPVLPFEILFVNSWERQLDSVYLGFFVRQHTFDESIPYQNGQNTIFYEDIGTAIGFNTVSQRRTPYGLTILGASRPLQDLHLTYQRWENSPLYRSPESDPERYRAMSAGSISTNTDPGVLSFYLLAVGPFGTLHPGDTVKLALALVGGENPTEGRNNVRANAIRAHEIYSRNYAPPLVPQSPPLKIIPADGYVTLDWHWYEGYRSPNPEETWDDSNHYVQGLPDTSWRRRNPPPGKTAGGRVFEAYRIWRSEYPVFKENTFSLLKQFDVNDELGFEGQTGLRYTFTDSMVVRGKRYWYAVTSVNIPDYIVTFDTLVTEPMESALHENAASCPVPFETSTEVGKVIVVPNPYRTDMDYTHEGGGWEGLGRNWDETKRLIWFIHLPPQCTIKIFSMAGEVIKTISHDDAVRVSDGLPIGQEEFYLLSESNRALASAVYVYTVESEYGKQIGKFVIIR